MTPLVTELNYWLALGGIALALATVYLLTERFLLRGEPLLVPFVRRFGLWLVLGVTSVSVVLTLVYSEVFGFVPCGLCWLQRIFLYPLPIIMALALWHRTTARVIADIGIALASLGGVVALYQHALQMGITDSAVCPTAGAGADCAKRILFEFGFMTFPLLSAITFAFVIAVLVVWRREG